MNLKEAKAFFEHGIIKGFRAVQQPMGEGWMLNLNVRTTGEGEMFETAIGHPRVFSSLDTLVRTVEQIGAQVNMLVIS